MNPQRKAKLKQFILQLPFGKKLLALRAQLIQQRNKQRKLRLKRLQEKKKLQLQREKNRQQLKHEKKKLNNIKLKFKNPNVEYERCVSCLEIYKQYGNVPFESATAFEIGSWVLLTIPMGLSLFGFKKIITVDIYRTSPLYLQLTYQYFKKYATEFGMKQVPKIKEKLTDENLDEILLRNFNIDYRAPYDATHTDLLDNSVDYVFSRVTFEHIRAELLPDMIKEMYRILRSGGICYISIDFKDHRVKQNSNLTIYDYLQYSPEEWLPLDRKHIHQNRLRLRDHLELFTAAGFEIVKVKKTEITAADRAAFATVKVADGFKQKYTDEELMEKKAYLVLRKP